MNSSAVGLMIKTYPFLFLRFFVNVISLYPGYLCVVTGIEYGRKWTGTTFILSDIMFAWLGLTAYVLYVEFIRKFVIHIIRYAQLAAVTKIISDDKIEGSMIAYGFRTMFSRFGSVSFVYLLDKIMSKAVTEISRWIVDEGKFVPDILKKGFLSRFLSSIIKTMVFHIDEIVVSYMYRNPSLGVWESAGKGISLYIKSWKTILKAAFFSILWMKVFSLVLRLTLLIYGVWLVHGYGLQAIIIFFIFYKCAVSILRGTFAEPYMSISMILGFYETKKSEEGLEDLSEKLMEISDEFATLILKGKGDKSALSSKIAEEVTSKLSSDGSAILEGVQKIVEGKKGSVSE